MVRDDPIRHVVRRYSQVLQLSPAFRDGDDFVVIDEDSINDADGDIIDRLDLKPTLLGLGLRIREWRALKEIASLLESTRSDITTSCFHPGQNGNDKHKLLLLLLLLRN